MSEWSNRILSPEVWRDVVGYEGLYEVSDRGRIRRIGRGRGVRRAGRVLKLSDHAQGYKAVHLWADNQGATFLVHRLVYAAFIGPIPEDKEINHRDGRKRNNYPGNLESVTRTENIRHAMGLGLIDNNGEHNPAAKLTSEQVEAIRRSYTPGGYRNGGRGYKSLAQEYGVKWETIRSVIKGTTWKQAPGLRKV